MLWPQSLRTRLNVCNSGKYPCSMLPPAIRGDWAHHSLTMFQEAMGRGLLRKRMYIFKSFLLLLCGFPSSRVLDHVLQANRGFTLPRHVAVQWTMPRLCNADSENSIEKSRFQKDLEIVQQVLPSISLKLYRYCWLIVNTRSFFYEVPRLKGKRSRRDCLAMCPFADLFNHADEGVSTKRVNVLAKC